MKERILLVEDSKAQKLVNERILHKAGYIVLNAATGEEALQMARAENPDLILLDLLLPGMGGRQVLHTLKQAADITKIPVIVLSSLPQTNSAKLRGEGAADYFQKSRLVDDERGSESFLEMIEKVLRERAVVSGG